MHGFVALAMLAVAVASLGCGFDSSGGGHEGEDSMGATATEGEGTGDPSGAESHGETGGAMPTASDGDGDGDADDSSSAGDETGPGGCSAHNGGCSPDATCSEVSGSVECTCKPGWKGDGTICEVDATFETLRVESPCVSSTFACGGIYCRAMNEVTDEAGFLGTSGVSYELTLHVRGVVEQKPYMGGTTTDRWNVGGTPVMDGWNVYALEVSAPAATYHLNAGAAQASHCVPLDYEQTIVVEAGAELVLSMTDNNNCQSRNLDPDGDPIVIPGIPPAPSAFDGQFVQIDMVAAHPVP